MSMVDSQTNQFDPMNQANNTQTSPDGFQYNVDQINQMRFQEQSRAYFK